MQTMTCIWIVTLVIRLIVIRKLLTDYFYSQRLKVKSRVLPEYLTSEMAEKLKKATVLVLKDPVGDRKEHNLSRSKAKQITSKCIVMRFWYFSI